METLRLKRSKGKRRIEWADEETGWRRHSAQLKLGDDDGELLLSGQELSLGGLLSKKRAFQSNASPMYKMHQSTYEDRPRVSDREPPAGLGSVI